MPLYVIIIDLHKSIAINQKQQKFLLTLLMQMIDVFQVGSVVDDSPASATSLLHQRCYTDDGSNCYGGLAAHRNTRMNVWTNERRTVGVGELSRFCCCCCCSKLYANKLIVQRLTYMLDVRRWAFRPEPFIQAFNQSARVCLIITKVISLT